MIMIFSDGLSTLLTLKGKAFEKIVKEGEDSQNQYFLLFPHCFQAYER